MWVRGGKSNVTVNMKSLRTCSKQGQVTDINKNVLQKETDMQFRMDYICGLRDKTKLPQKTNLRKRQTYDKSTEKNEDMMS